MFAPQRTPGKMLSDAPTGTLGGAAPAAGGAKGAAGIVAAADGHVARPPVDFAGTVARAHSANSRAASVAL